MSAIAGELEWGGEGQVVRFKEAYFLAKPQSTRLYTTISIWSLLLGNTQILDLWKGGAGDRVIPGRTLGEYGATA